MTPPGAFYSLLHSPIKLTTREYIAGVNMDTPGFNIVRRDHPANFERGSVSIFSKISLRILDECIHECINFKMRIGVSMQFFSLYRSLNQTLEEFETSADNLQQIT